MQGILKKIKEKFNILLDKLFLKLDKSMVLRTNNIENIPNIKYRIGGKHSYAEWAYVIGIFQTLIYQNLNKLNENKILDIGCGTGILYNSSKNFILENGCYIGIDVDIENINYCLKNYCLKNAKFQHLNVQNAMYANIQNTNKLKWNIENKSIDLITALSVWTHLNEEDAIFYFMEISRVLKQNSKAIITFFYLDEYYTRTLDSRTKAKGRFHSTSQFNWIFNKNAYNSQDWMYSNSVKIPENAIAINEKALEKLIKLSGLKLINYYPGNWKEQPGVYFQDILIFEK